MRKGSRFILIAVVALGMLSVGTSQAHGGCADTLTLKHKHTAAGSCKNPASTPKPWNIVCGTVGQVSNVVFHVYANQTADGGEVEACNDDTGGNGDTQGRLLLQGSTSNSGIRAILDSDPDQAFPAGWIIAEIAPAAPGIWCTAKNGVGDGYQQAWNITGPGSGPTCIQNLAPGAAANFGRMFDAAATVYVARNPGSAAQITALRALLFA